MRGEGGVAGEGGLIELKFHPWGVCTMTLTNVHAFSGLCIDLDYIILVLYCKSWVANIVKCNTI